MTRSRGKSVWYIPGGKREPGETDVETLAREIREELAVHIDAGGARSAGVFEAQAHAYYNRDDTAPETREVFGEIAGFFDKHLAR